ncbi:hypothetical protein RB195_012010 [Necator americanus]|uniref:DNA repair protein rad9 n=1 Tax=Necator americanus TaxID=51031 RepID=A0ABR1D542_NECAM
MNDPSSSVAQPLNRTLNGTITSATREKAVYLLHSNVKILTNAIAALSKIGDEIFLQPQERGLCLKAFNKNRSAYGAFLFADDFFSDYDTKFVRRDEVRDCRISTKTALTIFKSAHFVEKNLVSCTLTVDCLGRELRIDFQHTYDVSRSFDVNVMERHKPFTSNVDRNDLSNAVTVSASEIASFLNEMHTGREELIMCASDDKFVFKNYVPCEDETNEGFACRTEITVLKSCFKGFAVQKPSEISFSMKEFKAIITFARQHSCDVSLFFEKPGSALIVAVESDAGYSGEFIIATRDGVEESDEDASPEATQEPTTSFSRRRRVSSRNSTSQKSQKIPLVDETGASQSQKRPRSNPEDEVVNPLPEHSGTIPHEEEPSQMMTTEPSRNPLLSGEMGDSHLDQHQTDDNFTSFIERRSSGEQASDEIMQLDDFEFEETSSEPGSKPMEVNLSEEQVGTRSNVPNRDVNVEFQRRFLGIGLRAQHQSQAAAAANAIVQPTQMPLANTRRR